MPESFADFLDDINEHIEREMAKVPPAVAESLLRSDTPLSTVEVLRILARSETMARSLGGDGPPGAREEAADAARGRSAFVA